MRIVWACALALALGAFVGLPSQLLARGPSAFMLAMLRRDGVLVPFAVHDGKKWSTPWPVPSRTLDAPLGFTDIPSGWWGRAAPTTTWTAWPTGGEPRTLHVTGPVVFLAHCLSNVGLRSDYQSTEPLPPLAQQHHPKDGLATTGAASIEAIQVLDEASPDWKQVLEAVTPSIEKAEAKGVTAEAITRAQSWKTRRQAVPLKLEVLCRTKSTVQGVSVYYFEAVRQFAPQHNIVAPFFPSAQRGAPRRDCSFVIFSQGFVLLKGTTLISEYTVSTFSSCQRDAVDYGLPLGTITVDSRLYWIVQWSGFGHERYVVLEVGDKAFTTVLDVSGGAC